jgi:hypothetical protein
MDWQLLGSVLGQIPTAIAFTIVLCLVAFPALPAPGITLAAPNPPWAVGTRLHELRLRSAACASNPTKFGRIVLLTRNGDTHTMVSSVPNGTIERPRGRDPKPLLRTPKGQAWRHEPNQVNLSGKRTPPSQSLESPFRDTDGASPVRLLLAQRKGRNSQVQLQRRMAKRRASLAFPGCRIRQIAYCPKEAVA